MILYIFIVWTISYILSYILPLPTTWLYSTHFHISMCFR
nr:MAG TPA: hypothetical protein [Bacteriophage sp.]